MKKIIQIIPAVTNLYAVWEEDSDNGKQYGVDRAYYLGLDDNGEVYPLVIDGDGYIDTCDYDKCMVFDWDGYQMWKRNCQCMSILICLKKNSGKKELNFQKSSLMENLERRTHENNGSRPNNNY